MSQLWIRVYARDITDKVELEDWHDGIVLETQNARPIISRYQAAYALLWSIQTDNRTYHETRRHLLEVIGGRGSPEQLEALRWLYATYGRQDNLDPTTELWWERENEAPDTAGAR